MWNDNEFNSTFASPGGGAGKDNKKSQIRYILPVTGETINLSNQVEGENSVFEYRHLRFHHVCVVGIIRSVIKRSNDITYILDDMTSPEVTVKLQSDENEDGGMMENDENNVNNAQSSFIENQYIRVYGILKSLQGQKYIQAFRILPIKELNEITYHMLDCMNTSIAYANKAGGGGGMDMSVGDFGGRGSAAPVGSNPLKAANLNGGGNGGDQEKSSGGLNGLHMQISNVIKQNKSVEGLHVRDVCAYFKSLSESKVREILEFLCTEGHIYSTIDDEHYKTTDS